MRGTRQNLMKSKLQVRQHVSNSHSNMCLMITNGCFASDQPLSDNELIYIGVGCGGRRHSALLFMSGMDPVLCSLLEEEKLQT